MSTVLESVEVAAPVHAVYHEWAQFERFPEFMSGVEEVEQTTATHTHWRTRIAGVEREFDAEITARDPDRRIAWVATGVAHRGEVTFEPVDGARTRVTARLDFVPAGAAEQVGDRLGLVDQRVRGDLRRFKAYLEGGTTRRAHPAVTAADLHRVRRSPTEAAFRAELPGLAVRPGRENLPLI
ncbi:hypothetical protein GCM10010123_31950 [Pilimelia anulata]|uniref:Coenzyme Q-binding protein COQ10 START domain-containing protein n=1 Tax=Pilimelia anulata TaxID=53371 RepID=A0A8J3B7U3_9ACTN|nr:hypothetical protein GCM10010123_31950 [Pilimelia anulata]